MWQVLYAITSAVTSRGAKKGATGSRMRFVYEVIGVSIVWSPTAVISIAIWCTWPFLAGVRVRGLGSSGMWSRTIGFPVWTLRKMFAARQRSTSYTSSRVGCVEVMASGGVVLFPMME